ncbi:hypothetical protein ACO1PF_00300 [Alkalibacterium sp. f15]|uniref:hypothetical protein n=1 Tax=Alkalibacterium sp. f15 TaxID=3414029 RepID=UPI003BF7D9C8
MKKSFILIPLLLIATIVTIVFGQRYSARQREEMDGNLVSFAEDHEGVSEETLETGNDAEEDGASSHKNLEYYEEHSESLTLYEFLDFLSLKNGEVSLAYYGDIDSEEAWVNELNTMIADSISGDFNVMNHTYPEYDSYELYIQQTTQAVIKDSPDVIIYGMPALPDKIRDIGLAETEEFMSYVLDSLLIQEKTELLLLDPYPVPNEINQFNSRSLDYQSYLGRMQSLAEEKDITVLPLHSAFLNEASENSLAAYFDDNDDLNDEGTHQIVTILDTFFNEEL